MAVGRVDLAEGTVFDEGWVGVVRSVECQDRVSTSRRVRVGFGPDTLEVEVVLS